MAFPLPAQAQLAAMQRIFDLGYFMTMRLHLYSTAFIPIVTTTITDLLAIESAWTNYAPSVVSILQTPFLGTPSGPGIVTIQGTFHPAPITGAGPIWGWFLTDLAAGNLYGVQELPTSPVSVPFGEDYILQINYQLFGSP